MPHTDAIQAREKCPEIQVTFILVKRCATPIHASCIDIRNMTNHEFWRILARGKCDVIIPEMHIY